MRKFWGILPLDVKCVKDKRPTINTLAHKEMLGNTTSGRDYVSKGTDFLVAPALKSLGCHYMSASLTVTSTQRL